MKSFATLTTLAALCLIAAGCAEVEEEGTTATDGTAVTAPAETTASADSEGTADTADAGSEEVILVTVNANCPMNKEGGTDGASVEFDGKTVGFCCEKCMAAFAEKTDAEKTELVAAVAKTE